MANQSAADVATILAVLELDMGLKEECKSNVLISTASVISASYSLL